MEARGGNYVTYPTRARAKEGGLPCPPERHRHGEKLSNKMEGVWVGQDKYLALFFSHLLTTYSCFPLAASNRKPEGTGTWMG